MHGEIFFSLNFSFSCVLHKVKPITIPRSSSKGKPLSWLLHTHSLTFLSVPQMEEVGGRGCKCNGCIKQKQNSWVWIYYFMWFHSASVVFDSMNGNLCDSACAWSRLLFLSCLLVSLDFLLKHSLYSMLYIMASQRQLPSALFKRPGFKFRSCL